MEEIETNEYEKQLLQKLEEDIEREQYLQAQIELDMEKERNFIDTNKNQIDVLKKLQQEYHELVDEDDRNMHVEIDEINKYNQEIQNNEIEISFLE